MPAPYIGSIVIYHPRADEGRSGGRPVPAIVVSAHPDGTSELLVIFGADDWLAKWSVPPKSIDRSVCCWSPTAGDARLAELEQRIEDLEQAERRRVREIGVKNTPILRQATKSRA